MLTGNFLWPFLPLDVEIAVWKWLTWSNFCLIHSYSGKLSAQELPWTCLNASTWGTSSICVCTSHFPVLQWNCHLPLTGSLQFKRTLCNLESSKGNLCGNSWTQVGRITGAEQWSVRSGNANWREEMQRCRKNAENMNTGTTKGQKTEYQTF